MLWEEELLSSHNILYFKMIYGNFSDVITRLIESQTLEQVKLTWHRVRVLLWLASVRNLWRIFLFFMNIVKKDEFPVGPL